MIENNFREEKFNRYQKEFLIENCNYSKKETIFLSFDIDWAPDFMLETIANLVSGLDVSFMHTHKSKISSQIAQEFPSGIHPNILKNSDQGSTLDEVIHFFKKLKINFDTCRFHRLHYGYSDLKILSQHGVQLDSSTILFNGKNIIPNYHYDIDIILAPYFWEDGINITSKKFLKTNFIDWETKGLKIFDFHPVDIYLNTSSIGQKELFKSRFINPLESNKKSVDDLINKNDFGTLNILKDILKKHINGEIEIKSLLTLNKEFRNSML